MQQALRELTRETETYVIRLVALKVLHAVCYDKESVHCQHKVERYDGVTVGIYYGAEYLNIFL